MKHLLIDSCVWLNIFSRPKFAEISDKIITLLNTDSIKIIMPEIVTDELNKHRPELKSKYIKSSISPLKTASKILKEHNDADYIKCKKLLDNLIADLNTNIDKILLSDEKIDNILNHKNTINITIKEDHYKQAINLGRTNKAPFIKNKNSVSDALIICAFKDYINDNKTNCILITENTTDFSNTQDNRKIHPDINEFINIPFEYSINIANVINEIEPKAIDNEVIEIIEENIKNNTCIEHDFQDGCWRHSIYGGGLSWHKVCRNCGSYFDTGEFDD